MEQIEESVVERLVGLTEMVPDPWWNFGKRAFSFSYWLVGRSAWVIGTSLAILWFPAFIEQQRIEMVTMQDMQTKQVTHFVMILENRISLINFLISSSCWDRVLPLEVQFQSPGQCNVIIVMITTTPITNTCIHEQCEMLTEYLFKNIALWVIVVNVIYFRFQI